MPDTDIDSTTQTSMKTIVKDYSVSQETIDEAASQKETYWYNDQWKEYLGYYKKIPELKKAVDALAMWSFGKGWDTENTILKTRLEKIRGWGEDTFDSILFNMLVVKKINGDAYAEIVRKKQDDLKSPLVNLKPLNPETIRHVVNRQGIIIRYDEMRPRDKKVKRSYKPSDIFHVSNERVANEIHGTSVVEACKWVIDSRNEAMADWRRVLHRSSIRVMYIDADDDTRLSKIKTEYADAIKNGELWLLPAKKGEAEIEDLTTPPLQPFLDWIRYLENFFYQAVGVPKIILGGSQDFTEASSKIGYLTFEVPYSNEQRLMEQDLWTQLAIKLKFNRPPSLKEPIQQSEEANTGQVGFQPNETTAQLGRVE